MLLQRASGDRNYRLDSLEDDDLHPKFNYRYADRSIKFIWSGNIQDTSL
jgi:hypothetical protein